LTPFLRPNSVERDNFNRAHKKTRRIVENAIGLWKSVFRRIDGTEGIIIYKPEKACKVIVATAVLHNMRRKLNLAEDLEYVQIEDANLENAVDERVDNEVIRQGQVVREDLVNDFFS